MKNLTQIIFAFFCFCLPTLMQAQKDDDSRYLVGAVPEIDGKVVFTQEFNIPGMSQDEIYNRVLTWMETDLKKNENNSRVVYSNPDKGQIVGIGEEWIVFKSTALSLDRTEIQYQLTATCQPEKCILEIGKIRYEYREGEEKYTAEEWITENELRESSKTLPPDKVTSTAYIAVRMSDNKIVGMINFRHHINHPILSTWGGHIGYSVRPCERKKGYATEMLRQVIINCKIYGLDKILVTCDKDNIGSKKAIITNGGLFEKDIEVDGDTIGRYWIKLQ